MNNHQSQAAMQSQQAARAKRTQSAISKRNLQARAKAQQTLGAIPGVRTFASTGGATPLPPGQDTLVYVFLRGGLDGLSLCVPYGDPDYAGHRPTQAVPPPGQSGGALNLDGFFGLHPLAGSLLPFYNSGDLAFLQTAGSPDPTQSHFDAMKLIEGGYPNQSIPTGGQSSGWLGRHMAEHPRTANIRGIVLEPTITLTASGAPNTLPMPDPADFTFSGHQNSMSLRRSLLGMLYAQAAPLLADSASSTLAAIDQISMIDFANYVPSNGAVYPAQSYFGSRLERAAALLKAGVGLEMIELDFGGWDDHVALGANGGIIAYRLQELADSLAAFYTDLGSVRDNVTICVMSEFGRRVAENGSAGVDHGRGGCMFLMGPNVNGGQVFHDWQGLTPPDLDAGNLQVRLDYRNVLAEVLVKRMGNTDLSNVFPNFTPGFYNVMV